MNLTWDTVTLNDAEQLSELYNHLAEVDRTEETVEIESVREQLTAPGQDLGTDSVAVRDGGRLIGFGFARVSDEPDREGKARGGIDGGVHAEYRRQGIGARILRFQERRVAELLEEKHPGLPGHVHAGGGVDGASVRFLLQANGYTHVRSFNDLLRPLPGERIEVPQRDDVQLVTPGTDAAESVRSAHNAAFRDHWGSAPITAERWNTLWGSHTARREYSSIAVDSAGTVLAYTITSQWKPGELYIDLVGTRPEARGRGLARTVIARTLQEGADAGIFDRIGLDVDGESLTGADKLYARLGFVLDKSVAVYGKEVR